MPVPDFVDALDLTGVDYLFICVKFAALGGLLDALPKDGEFPRECTIVCTLNGIEPLRLLRRRFPHNAVVPISVMYNAQLVGPLHARLTTKPIVVVGTTDKRLISCFHTGHMVVHSAQGEAAVWGKLLINLANAVCALTHTTFKDLFSRAEMRRVYVTVLDEAIDLLEQLGIRYRLPMPVSYGTYRWMLLHGVPLGRLAVSPDGTIWFAEMTHASVTQLKDGRFIRHSIVPTPGNSTDAFPFGVAVAPDGTVWATLQNADALLRIAPSGETAVIDVPIRQSGLSDIAVAKDGAVWFLSAGANKVGRYAGGRFEEFSVPTANAGLTALAVAPDGAAWFTALRAHRLGRVFQGVVTEFALPRNNARPISIAVDAENNVWYADLAGWIGKLSADRAKVR